MPPHQQQVLTILEYGDHGRSGNPNHVLLETNPVRQLHLGDAKSRAGSHPPPARREWSSGSTPSPASPPRRQYPRRSDMRLRPTRLQDAAVRGHLASAAETTQLVTREMPEGTSSRWMCPLASGRGGRIRTDDLFVPNAGTPDQRVSPNGVGAVKHCGHAWFCKRVSPGDDAFAALHGSGLTPLGGAEAAADGFLHAAGRLAGRGMRMTASCRMILP